jgi:CheY-like chemotaxis protein
MRLPLPPGTIVTARASIMIVDDDDDLRETLGECLQLNGYDVSLAINGLDAFTQLRAGPRAIVILLDLMMPVMDGAKLVAELRQDEVLRGIPIIIITAAGNSATTLGSLETAGHIRKPFKIELLLAMIADLCRYKHLARTQ